MYRRFNVVEQAFIDQVKEALFKYQQAHNIPIHVLAQALDIPVRKINALMLGYPPYQPNIYARLIVGCQLEVPFPELKSSYWVARINHLSTVQPGVDAKAPEYVAKVKALHHDKTVGGLTPPRILMASQPLPFLHNPLVAAMLCGGVIAMGQYLSSLDMPSIARHALTLVASLAAFYFFFFAMYRYERPPVLQYPFIIGCAFMLTLTSIYWGLDVLLLFAIIVAVSPFLLRWEATDSDEL